MGVPPGGLVCCMAEVGNELTLYIRSPLLNLNEVKQVHTGFWWGVLREKDHLEDLGVDGRLVLKWFFMDWIDLVQGRSIWWAPVNAVMDLRVP